MVRPSKTNTNLLTIDAGFERKRKFNNAIGKKSITTVLIEYMDSVVEEYDKQKKLMAGDKSAVKVCYTSIPKKSNQATLDKYFPDWLLNHKDYKSQEQIYKSLTEEQKTQVMVALNRTTERFKSYRLGDGYRRKR